MAAFVDLAAQVAALVGRHAARAARRLGAFVGAALLFGARVETACVTLFAQARIIAIAALYLFIPLSLHLLLLVTAWWRLVLRRRQAGGKHAANGKCGQRSRTCSNSCAGSGVNFLGNDIH
ncbi:MAG: hypothetical protein RSH52_08485 [Janthinobacterium sp.]